jgi:hypothetical protein
MHERIVMSVLSCPAVPGGADAVADGSGELAGALVLDEPVVVLTAARSGSTLLRFVLDAHPELACPSETNLVKTAVQLAATWRLLDGPGGKPGGAAASDPGVEPGELPAAPDEIPAEARAAARSVLDGVFTRYLTRRGKRRWCEKSLGTAVVAEAFSRLYPKSKFVCLYRHCMDMIASGLEACPWGVAGYGFDPYVGHSPGNNAAALAHYWSDYTAAALEFEEAHPEACLRVHYEDLAADPQATAGRIFSFLGVAEVPGIGERCLTAEHDWAGPADYKIWATGEISADSIGRGVRVPAGVIPAPLLAAVNELLGKLGYATVGEDWNEQGSRPVLRPQQATGVAAVSRPEAAVVAPDPELDKLDKIMTERITARLAACGARTAGRSGQIAFTAHSVNGSVHELTWHVDLDQGALTRSADAAGESAWRISGDGKAWLSVLSGQTNLGVAFRRGELRPGKVPEGSGLRRDSQLGILADLLGLTPEGPPRNGELT